MASGVWEQALEDAAKELDAPATDFKVEKLATLTLLLKVQRSQWAQGKFTATNEMLAVMGEIERMRREHGKDGIQEINVHIVPSAAIACPSCSHEFNPHNGEPVTPKPLVLRTQCPYCHRASEICTDGPFPEGNPGKPIPQPPALAAQAAPAPAEPSLTVKGYREGVSASAIRASVLSNNEVPPVKKLQPSYYDMPRRTVSPMSDPGIGSRSGRRRRSPNRRSERDWHGFVPKAQCPLLGVKRTSLELFVMRKSVTAFRWRERHRSLKRSAVTTWR